MNDNLLVPLMAKGTRLPLFIVPAAGATPYSSIGLARMLKKSSRPVYSFDVPGMEDDRPAHESIEEKAAAYLAAIETVQTKGPYHLCGNCGGALVALEMAAQLEAKGAEVAPPIFIEAIPPRPTGTDRGGASNGEQESEYGSVSMERALQTTIGKISSQLEQLPKEYTERFTQFSWQQLQIADRYRAPQLKSPIVLIRTKTHSATVYAGWKEVGSSGIEEHIVPGDASSMLRSPHVARLGEKLNQILDSLHP